jgi:hypothetical protein
MDDIVRVVEESWNMVSYSCIFLQL